MKNPSWPCSVAWKVSRELALFFVEVNALPMRLEMFQHDSGDHENPNRGVVYLLIQ